MNIKDNIIICLEENGIAVNQDNQIENVDSMRYISTVVSLEEKFGIEIPDEYLIRDILSSVDELCNIIENILSTYSF